MVILAACAAPEPSQTVPAPGTPVPVVPEVVVPAEPQPPQFQSTVEPLPAALREQMIGVSWHEGCPVSLDALVWIRASHHDDQGGVQTGELVVAAEHADVFVDVLRQAFDSKYPITRMVPVCHFGGDDRKSMAANNTSAFNCRAVTGGSSYSEHSHGHAIDINPLTNPYVSRSGKVQPKEGAPYVDRSKDFPQKLDDSVIVTAFEAHGWGWGGRWKNSKDYQHFSVNGR